jgi:SAM-dependent methyltransferase
LAVTQVNHLTNKMSKHERKHDGLFEPKRFIDPKVMDPIDSKLSYHFGHYTYFGRVADLFGESLDLIQNPGFILDNGCHTGMTTREMVRRWKTAQVVGLDVKQLWISHALEGNAWSCLTDEELDRLKFVLGDGYFPKKYVGDIKFDADFMLNTIYQASLKLSDDQVKMILKNQLEILRPKGLILISGEEGREGCFILQENEGKLRLLRQVREEGPDSLQQGISRRLIKIAADI